MRGCFGWMALSPVGASAGGGCANELGGCRSGFLVNIPNKKPQTTFIWVPFGLNHSVMGKKRRVGTGCEAVWSCVGVSEPIAVISAGRVAGVVRAGVVCWCRGTASRRARVVKGMDWKPIVISRAGSCPADDAMCRMAEV